MPDFGTTGGLILGAFALVAGLWLAFAVVRALVPADLLRRLLTSEEKPEKPQAAKPRPPKIPRPATGSQPPAMAGQPDPSPAAPTPSEAVPEAAWANLSAINRIRPGAPEAQANRLKRMTEIFLGLVGQLNIEGRDDTAFGHARTKVLASLGSGQFERAQALLEHASEKDTMLGRRDPVRLSAVLSEAATARAMIGDLKSMQLMPADSLRFYREAVALVPADNPGLLLHALDRWGQAVIEAGDPTAAMAPLQRALELREAALGPGHREVMANRDRLIGLYIQARQPAAAGAMIDRSLDAEAAMTDGDPDRPDPAPLTQRIGELAALLRELGQVAEAAPHFQRALDRLERWGDGDPGRLAQEYANLAQLRRSLGAGHDAIRLYRRALAFYRRALGERHPGLIPYLDVLADLHAAQGEGEAALACLGEAETIERTRLGDRHVRVAERLYAIGRMRHVLGQTAEAEAVLRQGLELHEAIEGPDHGDLATGLGLLARLLAETGRADQALPLIERAIGIAEFARGLDHPGLTPFLATLALALEGLGRADDAGATRQRIAALQAAPAPDLSNARNPAGR
jgi:tetratricopeptide (TPR) repeat protein